MMPRITNQNSAIEEKKVFKVQGTIKDTKETLFNHKRKKPPEIQF